MLVSYWLEKIISVSTALVFAYIGYLSFGYPLYFDRLFFIVLVVLLTIYKFNKNLFTLGVILLGIRLVDELLFQFSSLGYSKFVYYASCGFVAYKLKFDKLASNLLIPLLFLCILVELFWLYTNYSSPRVHTYVALLALNCVLRFLLLSRVPLFKTQWNFNVNSITLDYSLYRLSGVYGIAVSVMIIEYLIRHTTNLSPLVIYKIYPYLTQLISLWVLYLLAIFALKLTIKLKA